MTILSQTPFLLSFWKTAIIHRTTATVTQTWIVVVISLNYIGNSSNKIKNLDSINVLAWHKAKRTAAAILSENQTLSSSEEHYLHWASRYRRFQSGGVMQPPQRTIRDRTHWARLRKVLKWQGAHCNPCQDLYKEQSSMHGRFIYIIHIIVSHDTMHDLESFTSTLRASFWAE